MGEASATHACGPKGLSVESAGCAEIPSATPSPSRGNFGTAPIRPCATPRRRRFRSTSGMAGQELHHPIASELAQGTLPSLAQGENRCSAPVRSCPRWSATHRRRAIRCRRPPLYVRFPEARPIRRQHAAIWTWKIRPRVPRTKAPREPRRPRFHDPPRSRSGAASESRDRWRPERAPAPTPGVRLRRPGTDFNATAKKGLGHRFARRCRRSSAPDEEPTQRLACPSLAACGTPNDLRRRRFRACAREAQAQRNDPADASAPPR